ncbi:hypothetical protein GCM10017567_11820 [Amycolatopsis bullii]|uniref:Transposase n=1 Tax=Amycolatopsis bullii TaxID=941987 RepID=A0ABQ3K3N8_9PSEU|nr:hypothetical protein GCM10017567_11820 [Amycolatopsis bullii]
MTRPELGDPRLTASTNGAGPNLVAAHHMPGRPEGAQRRHTRTRELGYLNHIDHSDGRVIRTIIVDPERARHPATPT